MTDVETPAAPATVLDRLVAAGIDESRARQLLEQGMVRAGGEVINDLEHPLPWPARWVIASQ